jgi:hypothetical protein
MPHADRPAVTIIPVIVGSWQAANSLHSSVIFDETLRTADGGDIRPIVHVLPDVYLQLAAFIAAIQDTDLHRPAVPMFEPVHVSSPRVDLRRRRR